jgi:hypothetical protein
LANLFERSKDFLKAICIIDVFGSMDRSQEISLRLNAQFAQIS